MALSLLPLIINFLPASARRRIEHPQLSGIYVTSDQMFNLFQSSQVQFVGDFTEVSY